ncbi:hypothetical protein SAMN04515671_2528 [Nakamurella panacisegetis]|uniref:Uncharacterized protein n=1 Tax=Nakamurella panacisegetis TaxID=1090615 RepID=A0A1H0NXC2_9ACTN|nr:hypothetical protein [Nakamurella panacisegetis]SDO97279.1 hypothetical protein SAMN04515671_2528 [Nakamurella panacisegetis]
MVSWRELGGPARGIGTAVLLAVDAAQSADRPAFEAAVVELSAQPAEPTGLLLGALIRQLLEDQHVDGLDADDIRTVLSRSYAATTLWLPADTVRVEALLAVLSSALGIHEPGVTYQEVARPSVAADWRDPDLPGDRPIVPRAPTAAEYGRHAPLLLADLLSTGGRPLVRYLDAAFAEIARAEAMELP